ncbi:MAG: hypothetical protein LBQ79_04040, partial [Deltaproteobacteria bacterium]|nr:hypothetical protein [Deltaproteobacteria bacterium]
MAPELPEGAALTLSEPREAPDARVGWHTPLEGTARELERLPVPARELARSVIRKRAEEFSALGARLADDSSPDVRAAARLASRLSATLASLAAGLDGPERVFVVDGIPVVSGWWQPPAPALDESGAPASVSGLPAAVPPSLAHPPPLQEGPMPPSRWGTGAEGPGLLRPALAALAVFLLSLALFFLLSPGFRRAASAIPAEDPSKGVVPGLEDGLRGERDGLRELYFRSLLACRPADPDPPLDDSIPELPAPERRDTAPPAAGDEPSPLEAAPPPPP